MKFTEQTTWAKTPEEAGAHFIHYWLGIEAEDLAKLCKDATADDLTVLLTWYLWSKYEKRGQRYDFDIIVERTSPTTATATRIPSEEKLLIEAETPEEMNYALFTGNASMDSDYLDNKEKIINDYLEEADDRVGKSYYEWEDIKNKKEYQQKRNRLANGLNYSLIHIQGDNTADSIEDIFGYSLTDFEDNIVDTIDSYNHGGYESGWVNEGEPANTIKKYVTKLLVQEAVTNRDNFGADNSNAECRIEDDSIVLTITKAVGPILDEDGEEAVGDKLIGVYDLTIPLKDVYRR